MAYLIERTDYRVIKIYALAIIPAIIINTIATYLEVLSLEPITINLAAMTIATFIWCLKFLGSYVITSFIIAAIIAVSHYLLISRSKKKQTAQDQDEQIMAQKDQDGLFYNVLIAYKRKVCPLIEYK